MSSLTTQERILLALPADGHTSVRELSRAIPDVRYETLVRNIRTLRTRKHVKRTHHGWYQITPAGTVARQLLAHRSHDQGGRNTE